MRFACRRVYFADMLSGMNVLMLKNVGAFQREEYFDIFANFRLKENIFVIDILNANDNFIISRNAYQITGVCPDIVGFDDCSV